MDVGLCLPQRSESLSSRGKCWCTVHFPSAWSHSDLRLFLLKMIPVSRIRKLFHSATGDKRLDTVSLKQEKKRHCYGWGTYFRMFFFMPMDKEMLSGCSFSCQWIKKCFQDVLFHANG
ncbi:uncharacterized protein LOC120250600 [Dioscorea cayenensis subsp. rotundata]|uniref:Uncharacterized protein LOC120250600 n=1 Tax=Dioscorea cayennensis subsp. rotundata TaxID=55577 RepID=A0AB40AKI8_DIOCR|nr:uncharacterized protein LOC120250600 [Dioscorea cayenensis subsp. rotundata]